MLVFRPFHKKDQSAVKSLILSGLRDHFQSIDPTYNPDLNDIWNYYVAHGGFFLVVEDLSEIIGTGALIPDSEYTGRIVRVSVHKTYRRRGIGQLITEHLIREGRGIGYKRLVVETNDDWFGAIGLYEGCGFTKYDRRDGEIHMRLDL